MAYVEGEVVRYMPHPTESVALGILFYGTRSPRGGDARSELTECEVRSIDATSTSFHRGLRYLNDNAMGRWGPCSFMDAKVSGDTRLRDSLRLPANVVHP